jgi:hypothetical protein
MKSKEQEETSDVKSIKVSISTFPTKKCPKLIVISANMDSFSSSSEQDRWMRRQGNSII